MDRIVGGKYKLGRKIGSGSFGEIHLGFTFTFEFLLFLLKSVSFVEIELERVKDFLCSHAC